MKSLTSTLLVLACAVPAFTASLAFAQDGGAQPPASIQLVHPDAAAARKTVTGTVTIIAVLTVNKDLPAGTSINFSGTASAYDAAFTNSHSISSTGKVAAGKVSVTIKIPYTFLVTSTADKVSVSLSVSGSSSASGPNYNFSTNLSSTIALPANGKAATVRFSGSV